VPRCLAAWIGQQFIEPGLGFVDDSFRLADFFRTGARHQLGQRGLGGVDFGAAHRDSSVSSLRSSLATS